MKSFRMGYGLGGLLQKIMNVSGNYGIENTLDPDGAATMANYLAGGGTQTQSPDGSTTYTAGMNIPPGRPNPVPFPIPPSIMPIIGPSPIVKPKPKPKPGGKPPPVNIPLPIVGGPPITPRPPGRPTPPPMTIPRPVRPGGLPAPGSSPFSVPNPYTYGYGPSADFGRRNLDALTYTKGTSTPTLEQLFGPDVIQPQVDYKTILQQEAERDFFESIRKRQEMLANQSPDIIQPYIPPPPPPPVAAPPVTQPPNNPGPPPGEGPNRPGGGGGGGGGGPGGPGGGGPAGCFVEGTAVQMADGTTKEITSIKIGEKTKGGTVQAKMEFMPQSIYNYKDVFVSGSHWVIEDNQFVAVEDSKHGVLTDRIEPVYTFKTSDNRIWINDIEFGDFETGNDEDWEPHFEAVRQKLNRELEDARGK